MLDSTHPGSSFSRCASDRLLMEGTVDIFQRNNIIKLQSVVNLKFRALIYSNNIRYAWYKSGLAQTQPYALETALQYCFPQKVQQCK